MSACGRCGAPLAEANDTGRCLDKSVCVIRVRRAERAAQAEAAAVAAAGRAAAAAAATEAGRKEMARLPVLRSQAGVATRSDVVIIDKKTRRRILKVRGRLSVSAWVKRAVAEKLEQAELGRAQVRRDAGDDGAGFLPAVPDERAPARLGGELSVAERTRLIHAIRMKESGVTSADAAARLGYRSAGQLDRLIEREIHKLQVHELSDYREALVHELMDAISDFTETARDPGYRYDVKGGILTGPHGAPERDREVVVKANNGRVQAVHELSHLLALSLPQAKYQSVSQQTLVEAVRKLTAELAKGELSEEDQQSIIDGVLAD